MFFSNNPFLSLLFFIIFFFFFIPCIVSRTIPHHHNGNFQHLLEASRGSHITGISHIKTYFSHFGYLPSSSSLHHNNYTGTTFSDDLFDAAFESALIRYQRNLGLGVTGRLDAGTLSSIITPRCGVPDKVIRRGNLHSTQHYEYFPGKPRWVRSETPMTLTYAVSPENTIHNLSSRDVKKAFKRAFSRWASVIPVSFVESEDYGFADIKIGFYNGDHGDGEPFDGVLGVLAHSFSPESGRLHLDAAETWAVDFRVEKSAVAVDLESVATHEIGHLLGLSHSSVKEAVMYPSLKPRDKRAELNIDDIKGVQSLYGSNPNFRYGSSLEYDDMSANNGACNNNLGGNLKKKMVGFFMFSLLGHALLCACL